ncbi:MAG TPA: nucleotide exchange factor GrpE [Euzebya sp.]|nr:nucleotide exchange factor GrpE [Euzebya sp.]
MPDPSPEDVQSYDEVNRGAVSGTEEGAPVAPPPERDGSEDGTDEAREGPPAQPDPLAQAEAARDDYLDQLQRARADYDNLNKRRHKEVAEARERGQAALVEGLLEVLDTFGFALRAAEVSEDTQLAKGVQLVHDQLVEAMQRAGLDEVPGVGAPFDPSHHEALMSEADEVQRDHPEVVEVLRTGYRFKNKLLRPAAVKVGE